MDKFVIYEDSKGTTHATKIPEGYTEAEALSMLTNAGYNVLRPHAIVGKDEGDAMNRYTKASGLRKEAESITATGKREQMANVENAKMNAKMQGGIYDEDPTIGKRIMNVVKAPQTALVTAVESAPSLINPSELGTTIHSKFRDIYQNPNIIENIATDPTLMIPATGQIKAASKLPILGRYALNALLDAGIQTGATIGTDALQDKDITGKHIAENVVAGTVGGTVAKGAGELVKMGGKKILQSKFKNKIGADNQLDIDQLMAVEKPNVVEGQTGKMNTVLKHVVRPFTDINTIDKDVNNAIKEYAALETQNIGKHSLSKLLPDEPQSSFDTGLNLAAYDQKLRDGIDKVRGDIKRKLNEREINEDMYNKAMGVIALEEKRLIGLPVNGKSLTPATPYEINNARKDFGNLSRYDVSNSATSDPTTRNAYRGLHDMSREALIWSEGHKVNSETQPLYNELYRKYNDLYHKLKSVDPATLTPEARQVYDRGNVELGILSDLLTRMNESRSKFAEYAPKMRPLMSAREPIEKAVDRSENAFPLPLTMLVGAGAGGAGTQSVLGSVVGGAIPLLSNSTRAGTALYRGSPLVGKTGRYAIPTTGEFQDK